MHPRTFIAGAFTVGALASAHGPSGPQTTSGLVPRHGPDGDEGKTTMIAARGAHGPTKVVARAPATTPTTDAMPSMTHHSYDPTKVSKFQSDMHKLHTKIRADPLYTSMTKALKTAIPESYREAMRSNPASVHMKYHTAPPDWYKKLPSDIRNFMEKNQKDAKSIWEKDMGPIPTSKNGKDSKQKDDKKAKSDAPGLSLVGATVCALVGAFGVAALLL